MEKFLETLRTEKGIRPADYLQFTAAFFVDADGYLLKRISEIKAESAGAATSGTVSPLGGL